MRATPDAPESERTALEGPPRDWGRAAVTAYLFPLAAYLYVGRFRRGVFILLAAVLLAIVLTSLPESWRTARPVLLFAWALPTLAVMAMMIDCAWIVRSGAARGDRDYQHGLNYFGIAALFVIFGFFWPTVNMRLAILPERICGQSWRMEPALRPGECYILARKDRLRKGDIVVMDQLTPTYADFSRVAALAGDVISIDARGTPTIDDVRLDWTPTAIDDDWRTRSIDQNDNFFFETNLEERRYVVSAERKDRPPYPAKRVPDEGVYLLADARDVGLDSRGVGAFPASRIWKSPVMVLFSRDRSRIGTIP